MFEDVEPLLDHSPLFRSIFKNASTNAMQVMDRMGYILDVNTAFTQEFGYTKEDLFGKHTRTLFTEEDQMMKMPELEIERVNQLSTATDRNYVVHKDGSCIWASGESILAKDGDQTVIIKVIQNIHEQKLLEKSLKESQEFSESVVKTITDAVVVFDPDLRILKANNAFYRLFDINLSSVEGLYLPDLDHRFLSSEKFEEHLHKVVEAGTEQQFQIENGGEGKAAKHLFVKANFIDGKLANKQILLVISDVTDKVKSEQQRDDLISFVIHELRNPLSNITLCNTLIEEAFADNDKEGGQVYLEKSNKSVSRLRSLIQELYDATQAGAGNLQFSKSVFSVGELVDEVIEAVQLSNGSHRISKEAGTGVDVYADRSRISQVLTNYLINAIKYSPEGDRVDVKVYTESGNVILCVTDFGRGIPEEKIPHIFERYYRADASTKIEGLGLGLFLSKQIIDAHGGRVWIESKENTGSSFYFSIPLTT
ncbi:MAG TPA: PAS domain-containing sensor histidine kinase [Segetibacter sp.]